MGQSSLGTIFIVHNQLVITFGYGKICLQHNILHSSTHSAFANHGLHPKFDIQSVHKVTNLIGEDQTVWLTDVGTQLVSNLEET